MLTEADRLLCVAYRRGVRTDETRDAWRRYTAERRRQQYEIRAMHLQREPGKRYVASCPTHGVSGYQNFGCRCRACCLAIYRYKAGRQHVNA